MTLKLNSEVTGQKLEKCGFQQLSRQKYQVRKNLYKDLIYCVGVANIAEGELELEVYSRNTNDVYYPFYYNPMRDRNLVGLEVKEQVDKFIHKLQVAKIVKRRRKHDD